MAKQDRKSFFSDWLEKLQQESWQLELLISGLALFGIYESQDLLIELKMYVSGNSVGMTKEIQNFFIRILGVGWKIFFINLLVHVILRGLWIGAIGLRYVSQDIDYDSLNYSEYFTKMLQKRVGEFDDFIERLEKICSILFAYTFLLFLLFFSFAFFFFQLVVIGDLLDHVQSVLRVILGLAFLIYILFGLIVFIDFITLGLFKKIEEKRVSKIYGYIFTFYGWTTLTFLYRPLLYNFLDNRYTKRLFYLSIPYILIILLSSKMFTNHNFAFYPPDSSAQQFGHTIDKMNYDDLRAQYLTEVDSRISKRRQNIPNLVLNKYMNDEDYLRIFLKMAPSDYALIQEKSDLDPYWNAGLNFTLFSSGKKRDKFYTEGNEVLDIEFDSLRTTRRDLRKARKTTKDSTDLKSLNDQIKSITTYMTKKRTKFREDGVLFEEKKQEKIIHAFLDLVELEINGHDIESDLDCYFYQHFNNNEKGMLCMYPMDSLKLGKHELYYFKEAPRKSDNQIADFKIPFYKVRDND